MKLKQHQFSTQAQTSELKKPNPPTKDAIRKAKFKDKTFDWTTDTRSRNKRSS